MKSYEKLQKVTNELRKSYETLRKVTKSYKRVIGEFLRASFSEILEKWPPYKGPKTTLDKKQLRGSDRFRTSQKPFYRKNAPRARGMASHPKKQG